MTRSRTTAFSNVSPAAVMIGISTGVSIRTVGVKSIAVPTKKTTRLMAISRSNLFSINGPSMAVSSTGMLATVINHDDTIAAAARNITILVVCV